MILAAQLLLAVGVADIVRRHVPRSSLPVALGVAGVLLLLLGGVSDAAPATLAGLVVAGAWMLCFPVDRSPRFGVWPALVLAVIVVSAVVWIPERTTRGLLGDAWSLQSPVGPIGFDHALLALGVFVLLLESGNVVVRAALLSEHAQLPADIVDVAPAAEPTAHPAAAARVGGAAETNPGVTATASGFRGGRLIGPLERVLVLLLTLAGAYPLLAAMLAAKGIVRFPEISRDRSTGAGAEYFLVGSLVSWVIALGGAFLLWWAGSV